MNAPTFDYGTPGVLRVNVTYRGCSIDFDAAVFYPGIAPDDGLAVLEGIARDAIGPCHWTAVANGATYANDDAPGMRHIVFTSDVPACKRCEGAGWPCWACAPHDRGIPE